MMVCCSKPCISELTVEMRERGEEMSSGESELQMWMWMRMRMRLRLLEVLTRLTLHSSRNSINRLMSMYSIHYEGGKSSGSYAMYPHERLINN